MNPHFLSLYNVCLSNADYYSNSRINQQGEAASAQGLDTAAVCCFVREIWTFGKSNRYTSALPPWSYLRIFYHAVKYFCSVWYIINWKYLHGIVSESIMWPSKRSNQDFWFEFEIGQNICWTRFFSFNKKTNPGSCLCKWSLAMFIKIGRTHC